MSLELSLGLSLGSSLGLYSVLSSVSVSGIGIEIEYLLHVLQDDKIKQIVVTLSYRDAKSIPHSWRISYTNAQKFKIPRDWTAHTGRVCASGRILSVQVSYMGLGCGRGFLSTEHLAQREAVPGHQEWYLQCFIGLYTF